MHSHQQEAACCEGTPAHLQIQLCELRLPVCSEVFVTEAASHLVQTPKHGASAARATRSRVCRMVSCNADTPGMSALVPHAAAGVEVLRHLEIITQRCTETKIAGDMSQ